MANVLARRFCGFNRNLLKIRDYNVVKNSVKYSSMLLIKLDQKQSQINFNMRNDSSTKNLLSYHFTFNNSSIQHYSKQVNDSADDDKKLTLFQRFKKMYKEYWYVLLPVHLVTSTIWFGGFYYLAKSGVDIVAILESCHISDTIINPLRDSSMGYVAVAYALYKIATPARYTVTLGGTTLSINYLKKWGYIKPIPSKERLKEMYHEKKDDLLESFKETKEDIKCKTGKIEEKIKDKKEHLIDDLDNSIKNIKRLGSKIKSKEHVIDELKKSAGKKGKE